MSQKQIVEKYLDGFRTGNVAKVLECLADDVVWRLHGCETFEGKTAFAKNIDNEEFCALPLLTISDLIQEGERIVAVGHGAVAEESGSQRAFRFCEVFRFNGELIGEVDTFHIWNQ